MLREKFDMINVLSSSLFPILIKQKKANPVAYTEAINNKRVISAKFSHSLRKTFNFTHFALQIIKEYESEAGSDLQGSVKSVSLLAGNKNRTRGFPTDVSLSEVVKDLQTGSLQPPQPLSSNIS